MVLIIFIYRFLEPDTSDSEEISVIVEKIKTLNCQNVNSGDSSLNGNQSSDNNNSSNNDVTSSHDMIGTYGFARRYKNKLSSYEVCVEYNFFLHFLMLETYIIILISFRENGKML